MQAAHVHFMNKEKIMPEGQCSHTLLQETATVSHATSNAVLCFAAAVVPLTDSKQVMSLHCMLCIHPLGIVLVSQSLAALLYGHVCCSLVCHFI